MSAPSTTGIVSPDRYYIVCTYAAAKQAGIDGKDAVRRICSIQIGKRVKEHQPGQETIEIDDTRVRWTVTKTHSISPRGDKKMAYIIAANRYRPEGKPGGKP